MIYGVIPVGGLGTRLGLPFPKEMLPQKNCDFYNPVMNFLVEKMKLAGATYLIFVHGKEYKKEIVKYYNESEYLHIAQDEVGFANVLLELYRYSYSEISKPFKLEDKILFGMPDSVFDGNPFIEMLNAPDIVCGLFNTDDRSKVDRYSPSEHKFYVKTTRKDTSYNLAMCWGLLKFDYLNLIQMVEDNIFSKETEIGNIINNYPNKFTVMKFGEYLDIGTWNGYNKYLNLQKNFSNTEIERKYDALDVKVCNFKSVVEKYDTNWNFIFTSSYDHYYTNSNSEIEFIRFRESDRDLTKPDITLKNNNKTQLNRFELTLNLDNPTVENVKQFLLLMGATFQFSVKKECIIYKFLNKLDCVLYNFTVNDKKFQFIEIEVGKEGSFADLLMLEEYLQDNLEGFDSSNIVRRSKFKLIMEELGK